MQWIKYFVLLFVLVIFACDSSAPTGLAENEVITAKSFDENKTDAAGENADETKFKVETVASGLEVPWGFAFLPDGKGLTMLFTERPGRVRLIENGKLKDEVEFKVPDVEPSSESGLMDISLHPEF